MRKISQGSAILVIFAMAAVGFAEQVDNPTYQNWARYKPGTSVTLKQSARMSLMPDMATDTVITQKLVAVKPDAATIEVTMKTTMMGQTTEKKSTSTIAARIEKGQEHIPRSVSEMKVEMRELKEGHETIEVKGVKVEAITREFRLTMASAAPAARLGSAGGLSDPMTAKVKIWTVAEIPGGTAKVDQYMDMGEMGDIKTSMTLVDYTIAGR